jgi:hypothetical protein
MSEKSLTWLLLFSLLLEQVNINVQERGTFSPPLLRGLLITLGSTCSGLEGAYLSSSYSE